MRDARIWFGMAAGSMLLAACAAHRTDLASTRLSPPQAVIGAAASPTGISGDFELVVRASGRQSGMLYLNSERDYRDQRNLSIAIAPAVERALAERLGAPVQEVLAGKTIVVRGTARKTRIDFLTDGRPTGKYYYQTHLMLYAAAALRVAG